MLIAVALIGGIFIARYGQNVFITIAMSVGFYLILLLLYQWLGFEKSNSLAVNEKTQPEKDKILEQALQSLKEAQEQLIVQEKMAAIGILSAGIAHEIKNPLNFINNFSDLTVELLEELKTEMAKICSTNEDTQRNIDAILDDIINNCKKTNEHGKRAESIIKNMLIQARTSEIDKTSVDINALLEEFISLSYHGMRAQNNKLNVKIEKNLDKEIKPITVNQQSIGRVILNILNNGLYAANEKVATASQPFMPTITVSSEQDDNYIIVKIKDNGNGIPENLRKKIFEPFFTTKPAGEGTGLGLPLCYDIVVNEHGGKLELLSSPGEYTEFIIMLPKEMK